LRSDKRKKDIFTSLLYNFQTAVHLTIIQLSPIGFLHSIPHTGSPRTYHARLVTRILRSMWQHRFVF